ncbi:hypothetical protein PVA38_07385 [Streptococcus pneumoniae D39]|nr:hypothetical protein PVA38_07385 [Streptococcus pneumoniae D39]
MTFLIELFISCLLYTSDAADEARSVDLVCHFSRSVYPYTMVFSVCHVTA